MMQSSLGTDERGSVGVERVVAWLLVVLAVGLAVAAATGPGTTVATAAPDASFEWTYDVETNALRVEHAGGDAIRAGSTASLAVVVSDDATDNEARVTWVTDGTHGVGSYPVGPGEAIAIDDASVDSDGDGDVFDADASVGFTLDAGDEARVVWRGRPLGAPETTSETLGRYRISSTSG